MAPASRISDLRQAGNEQFRSGQYSQAAALYSKALELLEATGDVDPEERSVLYSNRAACYLKDGNCSLCIKDCSVALDLVPFGIKPLLRRAAAYEALERYQLAYVDYKTVLQIDCTVQAAHEGVNRMTKALLEKDGLQWRQKLPPIPTVPVSAQRRWDSPVGSQEDTSKSKSNNTAPITKPVTTAATIERANALKQEGNEFVKKGNYKKAVEKYTESLQLHKLECATYTNRALCYLNLKRYKEAIQDCTEALKLDTKNVKAFYRRAQAYKELKNTSTEKYFLQGILVSTLLPPEATSQNWTASNNSLSALKASLGKSYKCRTEERIWVTNNASINIYDVQVQAFKIDGGNFGAVEECQLDENNMLIPIIVGAALAGLVLIVLIAYLIGRKRSHAGYQTI